MEVKPKELSKYKRKHTTKSSKSVPAAVVQQLFFQERQD